MSFVEFLCASLFMAWLPTVWSCSIAYSSVYQRDRWQCCNPVCDESASEPHHVHFRSRGGSDEDDNVIGLGHACHRPGIHEGRLHVTGTAGDLTWTIGRAPIMVVRGREKVDLGNSPGCSCALFDLHGHRPRTPALLALIREGEAK